jgi:beta-N-acetylhexosaminidase
LVDESDVRHLALSCLLPGFVGPTPPGWLLDALRDGLGGVVLFGSNLGDGTAVSALTDRLRRVAGRDIVMALDEEGGDVTRLDTVQGSAFPGAAALGALDDDTTTEECYAAIGHRLADAGVTMNLAPVADVNTDPENPVIGVRSFGSDPYVAARGVAAAVRGVQRSGVAACVKHFPGHGATRSDSHHEVATIDREPADIERVEMVPFRAAIAAGTRAIMTGHLLVPALDADAVATVSRPITTGLLRDGLGFEGTVVTDALEMRAVSGTIGIVEGFVRSLIAGADAIETGALDYPELIEEIPAAVLAALRSGRLTPDRLVEASRRTASIAVRPALPGWFDAAVVATAAARCIKVAGALPVLRHPLVIECRTPNGVATGELPWSLGEPLTALVPDTECDLVSAAVDPAAVACRAVGRTLVVVLRDVGRYRWQQSVVEAARTSAHAGDVVVVDVGWPADIDLPAEVPIIRTRGIAPGLLAAAARMLAQGGLGPTK